MVNFTKRIRYIVALPLTIISWYIATGILIAIVVAMNNYDAPVRPSQTYGQGFWYAIIAATLYMIGSMGLMVNMTGYFLGHYPQHFDLDDDQRTLILQTMMFFFWLAGGAAVFSKVLDISYANALYFCDVTVLTVGFGDILPVNDVGRGLIFPYSVIGIIFLGLMINSIRKFAATISKDNVIKKHQDAVRSRTVERTVTSEKELRERLGLPPPRMKHGDQQESSSYNESPSDELDVRRTSLDQYGHLHVDGRNITFHEHRPKPRLNTGGRGGAARIRQFQRAAEPTLGRVAKLKQRREREGTDDKHDDRKQKLILLREEKDRFDAMREIQRTTNRFKQYYALCMSVIAFGLLWCVGAVVFWVAEHRIQGMSYFQSLYFCYVSLLTIGYGDLSPQSNAGKPFFVVWSLVAIPTMTILISDMGDTVISSINRGTFTLADWTVLPKEGVWKEFLDKHPRLRGYLVRKTEEREANKRLERGFELQDPDAEGTLERSADPSSPEGAISTGPTLERLCDEPPILSDHDLARKLALAIKRIANDLRADTPRVYSYEEWAEFTRLIRFSREDAEAVENAEADNGLIEWDWIGEDSPMLADVGESQWILDRLCESLNRYTRKQARDDIRLLKGKAIGLDAGSSFSTHKRKPHHHDMIEPYPTHPGPREPKKYHEEHPEIKSVDFYNRPGSSGATETISGSSGGDSTTVVGQSRDNG